jgi:LysR family glycine cleavage system transcriptional activator
MPRRLLTLPPLDALRGFVAAARRMSITAAAADLCLTQSAVSRQIQLLEQRLGVALLSRSNRSIALTDAGEQLFRLASPWMDRLSELAEALRDEPRPRPVTVSASIGVASLWILPRLGAFQVSHPDIDIRVAANNRMVDLRQDEVDLAIRYSAADQVPAGARRLFDEAMVPVASRAVAASAFGPPGGLAQHILLDLDVSGRPWLHWANWIKTQGLAIKPKGYLHFNQYDQVIQAAIEGHGVALGRLALVLPMLRDGRLVAQMERRMQVDDFGYWLIEASAHPRHEVTVFRDWLVDQVAATSRQMSEAAEPPAPAAATTPR